MNNIRGINGFSGPHPIGPQNSRENNPVPTPPASEHNHDQVEFSPISRFLNSIAMMPDVRAEKIEEIRQALANGSYDIEGNLPTAVDRLFEEYVQE